MKNAGIELDRAGAIPLYAQIRDALRQRIDSHSLPPGTLLPTEEELQAQYGVSRSVVRQALGELGDLGVILRRRGLGSVVAPPREHRRKAEQAGGLRQQIAARGEDLQTHVVGLKPDTAPGAAAEALGTTDAWRLERVRHVGEDPVVFMRTWLPRALFPSLSAQELNGESLHDWMRTSGLTPAGGPRQVQAVPADENVAAHLGIRPGTPILLLEGVTRDARGRGLEWFSAWHRPYTVFDIYAQVGPGKADEESHAADDQPLPADVLPNARRLVDELASLLNPGAKT